MISNIIEDCVRERIKNLLSKYSKDYSSFYLLDIRDEIEVENGVCFNFMYALHARNLHDILDFLNLRFNSVYKKENIKIKAELRDKYLEVRISAYIYKYDVGFIYDLYF